MTNLWKPMHDEFHVLLLESEEREIRDAVHRDDEEAARQAAARDADCLEALEKRLKTFPKCDVPFELEDEHD